MPKILKKPQEKFSQWLIKRKIAPLYKIFTSSPEGRWIIGRDDVARIYRLIRRQYKKYEKINILELGTGIGAATATMAKAIEDAGGNGLITTIEQKDKCLGLARELVPRRYQKFISFKKSEPIIFRHPKIPYRFFSGFRELPGGRYDFLLIDGPSYWIENGELVDTAEVANGDFMYLLDNLDHGALVYIDGRRNTKKVIDRFFNKFLKPIEEDKDYAVFARTNREYKEELIENRQLEKLKQQGYF